MKQPRKIYTQPTTKNNKQPTPLGLSGTEMTTLSTLWNKANQTQKSFIQEPKMETYNVLTTTK